MAFLISIINPLTWISLGLGLLLAFRLRRERLSATYRWFFIFLIADAVRTGMLLALPVRTSLYGLLFMGSAPIIWALYFLVLRELFGVILKDYKGIASAALQAMYISLALGVVFSVVLSALEFSRSAGRFPILNGFFILDRAVVAVAFFLVLTLGGFLVWFPVQLRRNVAYYAGGYVILFLSKSLLLLARNLLEKDVTTLLSAVNLLIANSVFLVWLLRLKAAGEGLTLQVGHRWNPKQAEAAIEQLRAINQALARAGRR